MKAPSPAFSFYPKDILSDENCAAMTLQEFGAYVRLLMHAWLEGSVPADTVRLARILGVRHQTLQRIWPAISPCFSEENGRLFQLRMEEERAKQHTRRQAQAEKGRKGGRPAQKRERHSHRRGERHSHRRDERFKNVASGRNPVSPVESAIDESPGLATVNPQKTLPSPSPSPSPSPTTTTERNSAQQRAGAGWVAEACDDWNDRFEAGSAPGGKIAGQLKTVVKAHGWETVRPAWQRYLAETTHPSPNPADFREHFGRWLPGRPGPKPRGNGQARDDDRYSGIKEWLEWKKKGERDGA